MKNLLWLFLLASTLCISSCSVSKTGNTTVVGGTSLSDSLSDAVKDGERYTNDYMPQLLTKWEVAPFVEREMPEVKNLLPQERLQEMFSLSNEKLGHLKTYQPLHIRNTGMANIDAQHSVFAYEYFAIEPFENDDNVQVALTLTKSKNDQWQIVGIRVDSKLLPP